MSSPIKDQSFRSVPVSRATSSTRLNQITNGISSKPQSRPATPSSYVTSSLNPARNTPVTIQNINSKLKTKEDFERFENLSIVENLRQFEASLSELSQSVMSFKEEGLTNTVDNLIKSNNEIMNGIGELKRHQQLGAEIDTLAQANEDSETQLKHILKELISYRAQLKNLSRLPAAKDHLVQELKGIDVQTLLDYAMKLAKFSKTPATVSSQFIHPNNYIWPAEDALRRGMLAMASLKPDEIIRMELGETENNEQPAEDVEMEDVEMKDDATEQSEQPKTRKAAKTAPKEATSAPTLDLDLFDPEDDDSD